MHSDGTTMTSNEAPQALAVPYVDLTEQTSNRHQSLNTVQEVVQATCTVSVTPIFLCLQRGGGGGGVKCFFNECRYCRCCIFCIFYVVAG